MIPSKWYAWCLCFPTFPSMSMAHPYGTPGPHLACPGTDLTSSILLSHACPRMAPRASTLSASVLIRERRPSTSPPATCIHTAIQDGDCWPGSGNHRVRDRLLWLRDRPAHQVEGKRRASPPTCDKHICFDNDRPSQYSHLMKSNFTLACICLHISQCEI